MYMIYVKQTHTYTHTHSHPSDSQTWTQKSYQYFIAAFPKHICNLKSPSLKGEYK